MTRQHPTMPPTRDSPQAPAERSTRARLLDLLAADRDEAPTMTDLRDRGIPMPGQAIYELELDGYPVERVRRRGRTRGCTSIGYRLGGPGPSAGNGRPDPRSMR